MAEVSPEFERARDETRAEILRLFDVKAWQVGLAPVPRWIRVRNKIVPLWLRAWQASRDD